ncbi:uncharacterized protein LOC133710988 [Rosa rugosa]|uniref:uncharacterized protein LOC133710988 n=1 Tax=Rosa rugosa TaxID=74645 RepID=UPI002B40F2F0|nr:uncharacterized protein LOC133710988 [Rosa rugosa]XP_061993132.1 uncharacterized protein LOC133710988 [Rosa rugosa]
MAESLVCSLPASSNPSIRSSFLERSAIVYRDRPSIMYGDIVYTWRQTLERCTRLASSLAQLGISQGDVNAFELAFFVWVPPVQNLFEDNDIAKQLLQSVLESKEQLKPMVALLQLVSLYRKDIIWQGDIIGVNAVLQLFMVDIQSED